MRAEKEFKEIVAQADELLKQFKADGRSPQQVVEVLTVTIAGLCEDEQQLAAADTMIRSAFAVFHGE